MNNKLYKDRKWLYNKYVVEKKTIDQIAELCGGGGIDYWLKKFDIPIRSQSEAAKIALDKPEARKNRSEALKIALNKPETKKKMLDIQKEIQNRPEVKKKKSEAMKGKNNPMYGKTGENSPCWKGGIAKYSAIHNWVKKYKIKPIVCEICGKPEFYKNLGRFEWSNKTGKLVRDINNFQCVHSFCHKKYDKENKIIHEGT